MTIFVLINELYGKGTELSQVFCINPLQDKSDLVVLATLIGCLEKINWLFRKKHLDELIKIQALGIYATHLQKGAFTYEI